MAAVTKVKAVLGNSVEYRRTEVVGPKVGGELIHAGVLATVLALVAIAAYVWFRFEWQFGVGAMLSTLHDTITTVGLFSLLQIEFNLTTLAAILTIAGYSVNDTVVIYDRVRETMRKYKTHGFPHPHQQEPQRDAVAHHPDGQHRGARRAGAALSSAARSCAASASPCCGASSSAPIPRSSSPRRCSTTSGRRAPAAPAPERTSEASKAKELERTA